MPKFRIRLKVQALEIEIDGEREDVRAISAAVQQQFAGLIQPAEAMVDGHDQRGSGISPVIDTEVVKTKGKGSSRKRGGTKSTLDTAAAQPFDFRHDASKYGNPRQDWNSTDKSLWLLYVLDESGVADEVTGPQLAATFNSHFKAAKAIHPPVVTRELGKAKIQVPTLVGENRSADPSSWYLTNEGKDYVRQLIQTVVSPT